MNDKQLHDFLFSLYDYADTIFESIKSDSPGSAHGDNSNYFLTLIYIERIFDKYGRHLISRTATADQSESLGEAHRRLDILRQRLVQLKNDHNFNDEVERDAGQIIYEWTK